LQKQHQLAEAVVEAPAAEAVAPEVVAEVAEVPAAEATEASTETEEKE
jgi:large subunit ribosomal protein L10